MHIVSLFFLILILGAFLLLIFYPFLQTKRVKGKQLATLCSNCDDFELPKGEGLIYFWSPGCGPCKAITPEVEKLSHERDDVRIVNVAESAESARRLGVMVTPALVEVRRGQVADIILGARTRSRILALQK